MFKKLLPLAVIAGLCSISFFSSCKKETDTNYSNDSVAAYYPMRIGKFITYSVDSTVWNDFDCSKIVRHYQMRYTFADTFSDASGRLSYRVETAIRTQDTVPWNSGMVLYYTPTASSLESVEANLRYIKLASPLANGTTWDGNSMISTNDADLGYFGNWSYTYANVGAPYDQDSIYFDHTVTVNEVNETTNDPETLPAAYADRTFSKEVYQYNLGMVYREMTHWIYDPNVSSCRKGASVVMRAIDHN
jgi:hypothetical protein